LKLPATIDLHSAKFSATLKKKESTSVETFHVRSLRVTGAGDAWNAGNILGYASKLSDECRLALANAVAAYYVSSTKGKHPTRKQLLKFLEKQKLS
jgi:sugar/nucleoside kinase (ribokinase family)